MKYFIIFSIFISQARALEISQYKRFFTKLSPEKTWDFTQKKYQSDKKWYFIDKAIDKEWSPIGACKVEKKENCKDCSCTYYFTSSHPHNRYKGDFPYESYSIGYPHNSDKIPTEGCMHVLGQKGDCRFDEDHELCNISKDIKVVTKKYIEYAFKDQKDPCGIREFSKTDFYKELIKQDEFNPNSKK